MQFIPVKRRYGVPLLTIITHIEAEAATAAAAVACTHNPVNELTLTLLETQTFVHKMVYGNGPI